MLILDRVWSLYYVDWHYCASMVSTCTGTQLLPSHGLGHDALLGFVAMEPASIRSSCASLFEWVRRRERREVTNLVGSRQVISRQQRLRAWLQKCLKGTQDGERVETSIESIIRYIWIFYLTLHDIGSPHSNCLFAPSLFITAFSWCLDAVSFYILLLEPILLTYWCVFQLLLEVLSWFFIWNEQ